MIHRRLLLPVPRRQVRDPPPDLSALGAARISRLALELYRPTLGPIACTVAAESEADLAHWEAAYAGALPGGSVVPGDHSCPFPAHGFIEGILARGRVQRSHHWWPIRFQEGLDYAGTLAQVLTSDVVRDHEVLLQVLTRPVAAWEERWHLRGSPYADLLAELEGRTEPLFGTPTQKVPTTDQKELHTQVVQRRRESPWHVEFRLGISGPSPPTVLSALNGWLRQWESINGGCWWSWARVRDGWVVGKHDRLEFREAFRTHDLGRFVERRERRNVSATEVGQVLPLPWRHPHPGLPYAGSPGAEPVPHLSSLSHPEPAAPPSVVGGRMAALDPYRARLGLAHSRRGAVSLSKAAAPFVGSRGATPGSARAGESPPPLPPRPDPSCSADLIVGSSRRGLVRIPDPWNHLAVLGKTQSGKSTLVLNLVLQILAKRPDATVIVLEPTGGFVRDVVDRISPEVARDTVEVDPSDPTFVDGGETKASVPLGLLHIPDRERLAPGELNRQAEMVAGDILLSIKNAWGEDSVGGRVDFILGGILRGLLSTDGTNLVDAYYVLSDSEVRRRFLRTLPNGPLQDFFRVHLPGMDYSFTMSSLNKVGKIATNPMLSQALCQRCNPVAFEELLGHRLLLLNLAKGALGTEAARFLGAIYLTQLWAALQRTGSKDHPVYLVVDEFQNYAVPVFSDMLSEGAKFGLHVVAVTQYLHQVPEEIQAALHGNVSAWMFLALGAKDMDMAWKIADGQRRGWVPQDFVNGLEGHQMALVVGGEFAKVQTLPAPEPTGDPEALRAMVRESSRRWARTEDSMASPYQVTQEQVALVLESLATGSQTREELGVAVPLLPDRLAAVMTRLLHVGDVAAANARFALAPRGRLHLAAIRAQRAEGEEHTEIVTDVGAFFAERGLEMAIPLIQPTLTSPDGEFSYGDRVVSVEVECSTLTTRFDQVLRNIQKALAAGRDCLVVVPSRELAERMIALASQADKSLKLWEHFGLAWWSGGTLVPYRVPGASFWKFLELPKVSASPSPSALRPPAPEKPCRLRNGELTPADADARTVLRIGLLLLQRGQEDVCRRDFLEFLPAKDHEDWKPERLGNALSKLKIVGKRGPDGKQRVKRYNIRSLADWVPG